MMKLIVKNWLKLNKRNDKNVKWYIMDKCKWCKWEKLKITEIVLF